MTEQSVIGTNPATPPAGGAPQHDPAPALAGALVVGVLGGLVIIALSFLLIFGLTKLPSPYIEGALGVRWSQDEIVTTESTLIRSVLMGWDGSGTWEVTGYDGGGSAAEQFKGLVLPAVVVAAVAVCLVGLVSRRLVPRRLVSRLAALAAATAAVALVVGVLAAVLSYTMDVFADDYSYSFVWSHSGGAYALRAAVLTFVVGAFAYGVVARLPLLPARLLRSAALFVGVVLLAGGIAFSALVMAPGAPDTYEASGQVFTRDADDLFSQRFDEAAAASAFSGSVAAMTLPLALGAEGRFVSAEASPFHWARNWPSLQSHVATHPTARLLALGDVYGTTGKLVALGVTAVIVILWLVVAIVTVRRLGAPNVLDGAWIGAAAGLCAWGLWAVAAWLLVYQRAGGELYVDWSVGSAAYWHVLIALAASGAVIGLLVGALAPAPRRFALPGGGWRSKPMPAGSPAAPGVSGGVGRPFGFCAQCGTPFSGPNERFCRSCGTPRGGAR